MFPMAARKKRRGEKTVKPATQASPAVLPSSANAPNDPLVSVVVVTYQSQRHLPDLLHSLRAQSLGDFELVHVDSASTDATRQVFHHHWPAMPRLWSSQNLGYRRGNQHGMEKARGKYIVILNDDVELHPRLLEELVSTAEADSRIAIVAPAILLHGSACTLNAAGSNLLPAGFYSARGKNRPYDDFRSPMDIPAASGCCFLIRRDFLESSGGFSPVFDTLPSGWHASAEDLDLCWRAWTEGWRVVYQPAALLWHKYAQKPLSQSRFASLLGGRLVFVWLNYPARLFCRFIPVMLATEVALFCFGALRGWSYARIWIACWHWAWRSRRRLNELRQLRLSAHRSSESDMLARMQPGLVPAPDLQRHWPLRVACWGWFALNAACLGWRALQTPLAGVYPAIKRVMDATVSATLLLLLAPLLLALGLLVRWKLGAPALFRQTRIGLHEHPFTLLKFRSMHDAKDAAGNPLPDAQRLTPFGEWLRSWSLDELPQLWNVLRGEMSLIGPRPLLPEYLPRYSAEHRARHHVRPGLTGLAQVNGRNATSWRKRLDLDVEYVSHISPRLDITIAWRTLGRLMGREGISRSGAATMPEFQGLHHDA